MIRETVHRSGQVKRKCIAVDNPRSSSGGNPKSNPCTRQESATRNPMTGNTAGQNKKGARKQKLGKNDDNDYNHFSVN